MQRYLMLLPILLLIAVPARAFDMAAKPPADGKRLEPGQLYLVHYRCARPQVEGKDYDLSGYLGRLTSLYRQGHNPFTRVTAVAHGVIVARTNASLEGAGKLDMPLRAENFPEATGGYPIHVYALAKGSGSLTTSDNRRCEGVFVISGNDEFEVRPMFRYALNATDSLVAKTASLVLTSVSPAISLISGTPLAAKVADQVRAAGDLVANYKGFMELFREDGGESESIPLRVGLTKVGTFASRLEIDVRPIGSLLTDCEQHKGQGCVNFSAVLADLTRGRGVLDPVAADLADQCIKYELAVRRSGIGNAADVAYALYQAAADVFTDKTRIIDCLRPQHAANAAANARFYRVATSEQRLTEADVEAYLKRRQQAEESERLARSQPVIDRALVKTVDQFVRKAGRYACNNRLTARDRTELDETVRAPLSLADDTEALVIAGSDTDDDTASGSFAEIMDRLKAKGYGRYGCYSITHDNERLQRWYDGAEVMMLAFREGCGSAPAKQAEALGIRIFFDGRKIARLVVTDKWVDDMLAINQTCARPRVVAAPAVAAADPDDAPQTTGSIAGSKADVARKKVGGAETGAKSGASVDEEIAAGDTASATAAASSVGVPEITGSLTPLVPADPVAAINAVIDAATAQ